MGDEGGHKLTMKGRITLNFLISLPLRLRACPSMRLLLLFYMVLEFKPRASCIQRKNTLPSELCLQSSAMFKFQPDNGFQASGHLLNVGQGKLSIIFVLGADEIAQC